MGRAKLRGGGGQVKIRVLGVFYHGKVLRKG